MKLNKIIYFILIQILYAYNSPYYCHNIANKNFKLVPYHANNYITRHNLNRDECKEIIQEGYVGLMLAARKYNDNNNINARFSTYSSYWIKCYMSRYIKKMYLLKHNNININEDICKSYDKPVYTKINMDILKPLEREILYRRYIKKPRDITNNIACDYGITRYEVLKISIIAIRKLKYYYIMENT